MIAAYLIDIIILLLAAVVAVPLFQAARLGAVPGFLIAGVVVGPSGLGLITNVSEIGHLAEIGVVLLLFVIGIELKPSRLWLMRRLVFGLGTLQVALTGVLLAGVFYLVLDLSPRAAILVGPALALSSTAFVIQILKEQNLLTSLYGRASISVLLLQDLAVVPLLVLVQLLEMPDMGIGEDIGLALAESLLILGLVVVVGRYLLHPILYRVALSGNPEIFTASAVLIVLGTALATEHAGLSMAMGAFIAGLLISDSFYRHQVLAEIQPFRGLLLGLFFMTMGMSLDLDLLINSPFYSLALAAVLMALKAVLLFPITLLFGLTKKIGLAVAVLLAQSGEFALVLFSLAQKSELLSCADFQQLLLAVLLSMIATPFLAHFAQRLAVTKREPGATEFEEQFEEAPIVLAGFGRVGHRIGEILNRAGIPFVALDSDVTIVEKERAKGHSVYYGDALQPEIIKNACGYSTEAIIITLNDAEATEELLVSLRKMFPDVAIFARGHNQDDCLKLRRLGATGVASENFEASMELARKALISTGYNKKDLRAILGNFRKKYNAKIERESRKK